MTMKFMQTKDRDVLGQDISNLETLLPFNARPLHTLTSSIVIKMWKKNHCRRPSTPFWSVSSFVTMSEHKKWLFFNMADKQSLMSWFLLILSWVKSYLRNLKIAVTWVFELLAWVFLWFNLSFMSFNLSFFASDLSFSFGIHYQPSGNALLGAFCIA